MYFDGCGDDLSGDFVRLVGEFPDPAPCALCVPCPSAINHATDIGRLLVGLRTISSAGVRHYGDAVHELRRATRARLDGLWPLRPAWRGRAAQLCGAAA